MNLENFLVNKKMDAAVKLFRRLTPTQQQNATVEIERFIFRRGRCNVTDQPPLFEIGTPKIKPLRKNNNE